MAVVPSSHSLIILPKTGRGNGLLGAEKESLIITTWKIQCLCGTSSVHRQGDWHFHFVLCTLLLYSTVMGVIAFSSMQVPVKVISRIVIRIFASCKIEPPPITLILIIAKQVFNLNYVTNTTKYKNKVH